MGFRTQRIKAGKRVTDVMQELGVSDAAVYQWETGETTPKADKLMRLAKFYDCTIEQLLTPDSDTDTA